MDDVEIAAFRAEVGPCPRCGDDNARWILWGFPSGPPEEGEPVVLGGCMLPSHPPPAAECARCRLQYGGGPSSR